MQLYILNHIQKRTIEKSIAYYVIDMGPQEKINSHLATVPPEMRETFQMAIESLLDKSVRGALDDPSRAIGAKEGAAEDDEVVKNTTRWWMNGSSEKQPIPFLLGPNKRHKPSGDDTAIDIASERKEIQNTAI
jgi:hypothetical protein